MGVSAAWPVGENQLIHCMAMLVLGYHFVVLMAVGELPKGYITAPNAALQIEIPGCTVFTEAPRGESIQKV